MRYSQDLPLEEKQRLDQIHLNQMGVSPYRNGLNNENSGLNSMFPPRPEGASDQDWQGYLDAKASAQKQRDEGFLGRITLGGEAGYEHWKQGHDTKQDRYLEPLIAAQGPQQLPVPHWRDPARWVPPTQEQPTRPLPEIGGGFRPETNPYGPGPYTAGPDGKFSPPRPSPITVQPTPFMPTIKPLSPPHKTGGPFGGGQGKTFLNRFERLLDGLEGLVGKLGADGSTPESPFSSGGGGLSDAIETPFTPTQDY